jgi:hypothetical protein
MGRSPSIRVIIALLMVVPVVIIAALLVTLSSVTAHRIAENLGEQLVDSTTETVQGDVREYLASAVRISDLYARRLERGELPVNVARGPDLTGDIGAWERDMLDDLVTTPNVASICFGNAQGDATWLLRNKGRLEVGRTDASRDHFTQEFVVDAASGAIDLAAPIRTYQYDPRQRPWYEVALKSGRPVWTPIYFWFGDSGGDLETGAGYVRAIRTSAAEPEVVGVLVIDVTLGALSGFLKRLPFAEQGFIFITDDTHQLVASSHGAVNSPDGERLALGDHAHPAARAAAGCA